MQMQTMQVPTCLFFRSSIHLRLFQFEVASILDVTFIHMVILILKGGTPLRLHVIELCVEGQKFDGLLWW